MAPPPHVGIPRIAKWASFFIGITGGGYLFLAGTGIPFPNPFRTPGVKNIENRYSAGGGSTTHLPGIATPRGNPDQVVSPMANKPKGLGTPHWEENMADQKGPTDKSEELWNKAHYGSKKGK